MKDAIQDAVDLNSSMDDTIALKAAVVLDREEVLDALAPEDIIRRCAFYMPAAFIDFVIEECNEHPRPNFSKPAARIMLTKLDQLRQALELAAEHGDNE